MCTRAAIDTLLRFLPGFERPGRTFVKAVHQKHRGDLLIGPYPEYDEDVLLFFRLAGQPCWSDFDYDPREAARMLADETFIRRSSLAEVKTMLTYCVRGERFGDGHWAAMLASGKVVALLRRLQALRDTAPP